MSITVLTEPEVELTSSHSSIGGSVGAVTSVSDTTMLSGIRTSPKFCVNGTHQTENQSMSWMVIGSGRVSTTVSLEKEPRGLVLQGGYGRVNLLGGGATARTCTYLPL